MASIPTNLTITELREWSSNVLDNIFRDLNYVAKNAGVQQEAYIGNVRSVLYALEDRLAAKDKRIAELDFQLQQASLPINQHQAAERKKLFLAAAIQGLLAGPLRRHSLAEIDRDVELDLVDVADEIATIASGVGE